MGQGWGLTPTKSRTNGALQNRLRAQDLMGTTFAHIF